MTADNVGASAASEALARHIPVMLAQVLEAAAPLAGALVCDGTFGAGGYTRAMLEAGAQVIAIDRDPDAAVTARGLAEEFGGRFRFEPGTFSDLDVLADQPLDAVVLDIGVSSMQLDEAERGFSFRNDGPLDMRMAQAGLSAADVVNRYKSGDLARIFNFLGEERHAGRIARAIEKRRADKPFERTRDLAQLVESVIGRNPKDKIHPATRVFQALRIHVNDELGQLAQALEAAERALKPGGRLAVVTFHSLEDRIVKRFLQDRSASGGGSRHLPEAAAKAATFDKAGGVVSAPEAEASINPRARSAKLRAAIRTGAPARRSDLSIFGLPKLPDIPASARG
ncbi:MAG: 16S rRNA (cytosine(1402)-N(4))-methyltransferase RsmH [Notoacmeibacter sp.]|nr:16S rRNA (cytosine(1402)-N(4))-methyltransferase RsmH [Notoacmeibacter sp.]